MNDNALLNQACDEVDQLICWFSLPKRARHHHDSGVLSVEPAPYGEHRWQFLLESLRDLDRSLQQRGNHLWIEADEHGAKLPEILTQYNVSVIYHSMQVGWWEKQQLRWIRQQRPDIQIVQALTHTLFEPSQLPFALKNLPATFSQFRKCIEPIPIREPFANVNALPSSPAENTNAINTSHWVAQKADHIHSPRQGGESSGYQHLQRYFSTTAASHYKKTRNALDGELNSSKLSFWLANGCLSPATIVQALKAYEQKNGANESTYWILFELYWREYFQWYAHKFGSLLFQASGIKTQKPLTSFYAERFAMWRAGTTPYPIVNACMHQLNRTGYLSNRGRQLVASCLVNELNLDWRYGARYFEQQLIDYDVASNWGNWQYLAGVGVDPRGCRHFDLQKQTDRYDPEGHFIQQWQGECAASKSRLDSVDAADWPITSPSMPPSNRL